MSNGYLLAAWPDLPAAREISVGFGLEVIDASTVANPVALGDMLAEAANVGLMISAAAAQDARFVSLMRLLSARLATPQLILADQNAYAPFSFLPSQWPAMLLADARARASRRRETMPPPAPPPVAPPPPSADPLGDLLRNVAKPDPNAPPPPIVPPPLAPPAQSDDALGDLLRRAAKPDPNAPPPPIVQEPPSDPLGGLLGGRRSAPAPAPTPVEPPLAAPPTEGASLDDLLRSVAKPDPAPTPAPQASAPAEPPREESRALARRGAPAPEPETEALESEAPTSAADPEPQSAAPEPRAGDEAEFAPIAPHEAAPTRHQVRESAPADATAFAPKKLRRGTPELLRVVIHQPSQAKEVIKAAKKIDPNARPAPQGISIGDIAFGANVGIALEVHGARCEGALQRRSWAGEPIDFAFPVEAEDGAKQAVFLARVFVDDAQIGIIAFTRPIVGAAKEAEGGEVRLTRHKRVFISYASADRETVSAIATAYQMAGVAHFWDRTSLKSGEEWSPRLKQEIERADLFHLCWSKSAAKSEWVAKEAAHALKRKRGAKRPEITVQMLDGPPWAPHPPELDAINFDDFVRAAIVGYARGEA